MTKKRILFVCLGNICRSPAAEGIMKSIISKNNFDDQISVDSAGTIDYHAGEKPDPRMRKVAKEHGYVLNHRARAFDPDREFDNFDYIVTMDDENYDNVLDMDEKTQYTDKVMKMADFSSDQSITEIPDPYSGYLKDFENVINILENTCNNLFEKVKNDIESENKQQN